jgi:hypothetical protein
MLVNVCLFHEYNIYIVRRLDNFAKDSLDKQRRINHNFRMVFYTRNLALHPR